jgi:hypothetical protein
MQDTETKFEYSTDVLDELEDLGKAELQLVGLDGNAFSIIGAVKRAMRHAGFSQKAQSEMSEAAMSGDYNNVLQTAMLWTDSPEEDDWEEDDWDDDWDEDEDDMWGPDAK